MLDVFLCHSRADRGIAATIASRLERGAEARVWLDECGSDPDRTVAVRWDGGLSSAAILLLLSPESVPARLSRVEWEPVLDHVTRGEEPPLGSVLVRECGYPRLLERKNFFRWRDEDRAVLREIERWIVALHPPQERAPLQPARLPWFEGRQPELQLLWDMLVEEPGAIAVVRGAAGVGKTSLAQEFARQAGEHFRDILWVGCGDRCGPAIAGDLAVQLGAALEAPAEEGYCRVADTLSQHRLLLVLDDVEGDIPVLPRPGGLASCLITTRSAELAVPQHARWIGLENRPAPPALHEPAGAVDLRLWQAMSVCRPQGFPLEFAARIAGIEGAGAAAACRRLLEQRLVDPFDDSNDALLRLGAYSRSAARATSDVEALRRRHAEVLRATLSHRPGSPARCGRYLPEIEAALQWALAADWNLAIDLALRAFAFLRTEGRLAEGIGILVQLREAAERRQDQRVLESCSWELSWIHDSQGATLRPPARDQLSFEF